MINQFAFSPEFMQALMQYIQQVYSFRQGQQPQQTFVTPKNEVPNLLFAPRVNPGLRPFNNPVRPNPGLRPPTVVTTPFRPNISSVPANNTPPKPFVFGSLLQQPTRRRMPNPNQLSKEG